MKKDQLNIVSISSENSHLLNQFIAEYEDKDGHFRYFETRDASIIKNHVATYLVLSGTTPMGYGHLDKEGERVWLGIAVKTTFQGLGLGNLIMRLLLTQATLFKLPKVYLSVDNDNKIGIKLYNKFGFKDDQIDPSKRRMVWGNKSLDINKL